MDEQVRTICYVTREFGDLVSAGGVKDLAKGICVAAAEHGLDARVFLLYPSQLPESFGLRPCPPQLRLDVRLDVHPRYRGAPRRSRCSPTSSLA